MCVELYYNDQLIEFEICKNDIIEYLWEEKTGRKFRYPAYVLDDPGSLIYKSIEKDWMNNKIDEYSISHNSKFISFMTRKYDDELYEITKTEKHFADDETCNYINNSLLEDDE